MSRKGLGKGLDSLIPEIYDENFDSNSPQSLEDILNDNEPEEEVSSPVEEEVSAPVEEEVSSPVDEEKTEEKGKNIFEEFEEENDKEGDSDSFDDDEVQEISGPSEDNNSDIRPEDNVQEEPKIQVDPSHVDEVTQIVDKNPRITLWSSRSAAVLRYLRKTEPEFSISKEASVLIEEAVAKKYPEIWALFEDL